MRASTSERRTPTPAANRISSRRWDLLDHFGIAVAKGMPFAGVWGVSHYNNLNGAEKLLCAIDCCPSDTFIAVVQDNGLSGSNTFWLHFGEFQDYLSVSSNCDIGDQG